MPNLDFSAQGTPVDSTPDFSSKGTLADFSSQGTPVETKPAQTKLPSFKDAFSETGGMVSGSTKPSLKAAGELAVDLADIPASIPAYLGAGAAGLGAANVHAYNRDAGTHFGAGEAAAGAVMEKYGSPVRKILTEAGLLDKPKEGEVTSPVAGAMAAVGGAVDSLGKAVTEATGSQEAGDATSFGLNYLAPGMVGKELHGRFTTEMNKAGVKAPIAESVPKETYVKAWAETLDKQPKTGELKETAFRDKATGEVTTSGVKHDEVKKTETADTHDQGFVDDQGNFLDRNEAFARAKETKQIPEDHPLEFPEEGLHSGDLRKAGASDFKYKSQADSLGLSPKEAADPLVQKLISLSKATTKAEKESDPSTWTKEQKKAYASGDWETFSTLRGYSTEEKAQYKEYLKTVEEADAKYGADYSVSIEHALSAPESIASPTKHPASLKDIHEFNAEGLRILKEQGPVAADKFAGDVIAYKRNQGPLEVPKTADEMADTFFRLGKNKEADKVETTQLLQQAEKEGVDLEQKQRWRDHAETGKELSPEDQAAYNKYFAPLLAERKGLLEKAQAKGWVLPTEFDEGITGANVPRQTIPKQVSVLEKFKEKIMDPGKGGFDVNIEKKPGAALERGLFVAEFPNGRRVVVQAKEDGIIQWNKQKGSSFAGKDTPLKAGAKLGEATIKEATQSELEQHTPYKYNKDSQAVLYKRVNELRDFVRSKQLVEDLKASPLFKEISHTIDPKKPTPDGFVIPRYLDKVPEFAGMAFEKHAAAIIEDFAKNWTPNYLTLISGALVKNMMLNPLPHMMNEGWHAYNARGLTGWVTPAGVARFVKTGLPAVQEVMQQGEQFRSMLRDGASLLSAEVRNNPVQDMFMKQGMKEFIDGPDGRSLAEQVGMKPVELYDALSKRSGRAMWVTRDAMYMQLINEKMQKGMTQKEAIKEVERHMPNYRIGSEVMGSRAISQVMQNPNVSIFSRYHYGMVKSLYETAMDMSGTRGKKAFLEGADTAVAIAVALAVLYPMQDMVAQQLTGNKDATVRRAGPYHPMTALADIAKGEKDPQALLASVFTFNPALLAGAQLIADRKLYNGQPIYHPTDSAGQITKDLTNYLVTQVPQASTTLKVTDQKKGGGWNQWLAQQLDIKSPPSSEVKAKEKIKRKTLIASKNRAKRERNQ